MVLEYPEMVATAADDSGGNVVHDASELIVHHVKRQPNLPKREKQAIKRVLRCLVPRLFGGETESMSDDDDENGSVGAGATTTEGGTSGCTGGGLFPYVKIYLHISLDKIYFLNFYIYFSTI